MPAPELFAAAAAAAAAVLAALVSGFWAWIAGRRHSGTEAQVALVDGFTKLLEEFRKERLGLMNRVDQLEKENRLKHQDTAALERRIDELEKKLVAHNIDLPSNGK